MSKKNKKIYVFGDNDSCIDYATVDNFGLKDHVFEVGYNDGTEVDVYVYSHTGKLKQNHTVQIVKD